MALIRRCAIAAVLLVLLVAPAAFAQSDNRTVAWERYDVDLTLLPGGGLDVVETQRIFFNGTFRKGFREIPLARVTAISDISVEEDGRPYRRGSNADYGYTNGRDSERVRVDWSFPPTTNAARTFILRYRAEGALRVFDAADQIFWEAIYKDRPGPVSGGTVTIHLPSPLTADQVTLEALPEAALVDARLSDPQTARLTSSGLTPGTGFEVRVQIPHGLVAASPPPWQEQEVWNERYKRRVAPILNLGLLLLGVAIPVFGGLWLLLAWFVGGRDPRVGRARGTLTSPPSDLAPGLVGTLVDERADVKDVLATLVDLGNRDILRLSQIPPDVPLAQITDYRIRPTISDTRDLLPFERAVFTALSRGQDGALLSVLKQDFVSQIPLIRDQLHAEVARAGYFVNDPEKTRRRYRTFGGMFLVVGIVGFIIGLSAAEGVSPLLFFPFLTLIPVAVGCLVMSRFMPRRTRRGAIESAQWLAFARGLAEEDGRPGAVPTHQDNDLALHRYLPYAIALGVDTQWVGRFNALGAPRPRWFDTHDMPIIIGNPGYSGGSWGGNPGRSQSGGWSPGWGAGGDDGSGWHAPNPQSASDSGAHNVQSTSDFLVGVLNAASEALSSGGRGGSDSGGWSGGGSSGGGGGGGGSSGGGSGGFS